MTTCVYASSSKPSMATECPLLMPMLRQPHTAPYEQVNVNLTPSRNAIIASRSCFLWRYSTIPLLSFKVYRHQKCASSVYTKVDDRHLLICSDDYIEHPHKHSQDFWPRIRRRRRIGADGWRSLSTAVTWNKTWARSWRDHIQSLIPAYTQVEAHRSTRMAIDERHL